ncbi:peptidylprolyl isomerase [Amphibiibacter pelophylacis]|uniref:Peptidylprolyl isomerase n=1 Tax=Amphibiibacter pelophylacis TaxID=1799477 RepID=A0ACC6P061_9BURK
MISSRHFLAACVLTLPLLAQAQNIAIVNGKPVPKARVTALLDQAREQAEQSGQALPPGLEKRAEEEVVLREIYAQEAQRKGAAANPDFQAQLEQVRQALLIRTLFDSYGKSLTFSDADLQKEYDKLKAENTQTEYKASHILVPTEKEAQDILAQLKAGGNFAELAKKYSKDPGSGANGGDLGWSTPDAYVPEFARALATLKKGQITQQPVKSQFGWHIIELNDERSASFPPMAEIKPNLIELLRQRAIDAYRESLRKSARTDFKFTSPTAP